MERLGAIPERTRRLEPADITQDRTRILLDAPEEPARSGDGQNRTDRAIIQSVDRALNILEFLSLAHAPQRLQDIARAVGLKPPTCHHLVNSLAARGYVRHSAETRSYMIGSRMFELVRENNNRLDVVSLVTPMLETLSACTGYSACLAALEGTALDLLAFAERNNAAGEYARSLTSASHASALGKAILAWLPEPQIARVVADHQLVRFTDTTIDNLGDLVESLRQVRRHGFAIDDREYRKEIIGVARTLREQSGRVIGSVGLLLPAAGTSRDEIMSSQIALETIVVKIARMIP